MSSRAAHDQRYSSIFALYDFHLGRVFDSEDNSELVAMFVGVQSLDGLRAFRALRRRP